MSWHIHEGGRTFTATQSEVEAMIAARSLTDGALVWRDGLPSWQPIAVHFPSVGRAPAAQVRAAASSRGAAVRFGWNVVVLVALCGVAYWSLSLPATLADRWPRSVFTAQSAILTAFLLAFTLAANGGLLGRLWRSDYREASPGRAGLAVILCSLLFVGQIAIAGSALLRFQTMLAQDKMAWNLAFYSVTGDAASKTVEFEGPIGRGLLRQLKSFETSYGAIALLRVKSPGGLLDEALRIAEYLRAKRIPVVTHGACDSACVILALASPNSFAEKTLRYGFHQAYSAVRDDTEIGDESLGRGIEVSRAYFLLHGVPADVLNEAAHFPPDQVFYVPAMTLLKSGSLKALVEEGEDP